MNGPTRALAALSAFVAPLAAAVLPGLDVDATAPPQAPPPPSALAWGACEEGVDIAYQCATVAVPLNYADPAGTTIAIALIRYPADPARRDGAVLFNPGGPGGSGFDYVARAGERIDKQMNLARRFDIIGFDPRGVQRSGGIRCLSDADLESIYFGDSAPAAEVGLAIEQTLAGLCKERYGDTLGLYSTENTARDMDAIRVALGDEQISYIGISYGTYLGGVYASLFPERVRAMVLDSGFDPGDDTETEQWVTQLAGFEAAFRNWGAWCQTDPACAFTAVDVGARWDALIDRLGTNPLIGQDGRPVGDSAMMSATRSALYDELRWPVLASALAAADRGDAEKLLALADEAYGRSDDGTYADGFEVGTVIRCASGIDRTTPVDPGAMLESLRQAAPRMSRFFEIDSFYDECVDWVGADIPPLAPTYMGSAPILVVGGLNDPATPFRWSTELAARMGPRSTLVSYSGEGHGFMLTSSCVTYMEAMVIRDLVLPAPSATCDPDGDVSRPAFWDQLPVPSGVGELAADPDISSALSARPSQYYADVRTLTGDVRDISAAYVTSLTRLGYRPLDFYESDPDVLRIEMMSPDGVEILIMLMSPTAVARVDRLDVAEEFAPPGFGLVMIAARAAPPAK